MKKFDVTLRAYKPVTAVISVEAETRSEAFDLANARLEELDKLHWQDGAVDLETVEVMLFEHKA